MTFGISTQVILRPSLRLVSRSLSAVCGLWRCHASQFICISGAIKRLHGNGGQIGSVRSPADGDELQLRDGSGCERAHPINPDRDRI